jgi:hypothetical protein
MENIIVLDVKKTLAVNTLTSTRHCGTFNFNPNLHWLHLNIFESDHFMPMSTLERIMMIPRSIKSFRNIKNIMIMKQIHRSIV